MSNLGYKRDGMGDRGGIRGFCPLLRVLRDPGRIRSKIPGAKRKICKNFSNEKENGRKNPARTLEKCKLDPQEVQAAIVKSGCPDGVDAVHPVLFCHERSFAGTFLERTLKISKISGTKKETCKKSWREKENAGKLQVPLPPLAEQHEIVRRVEPLFARADAAEREVAAATTKRADALTQAVLARAFQGKL